MTIFTFSLGVQDENGTNLIPVPSWYGKVEYKAGTKITYTNNGVYPDRLEIEGPTNMTLKIVVNIFFFLITTLKMFNYGYSSNKRV